MSNCEEVGKGIFSAVKNVDTADKRWREDVETQGLKHYRFWVDLYEGLNAGTVAPGDATRLVEKRSELSEAEHNLTSLLSIWLKRCPTSKIR